MRPHERVRSGNLPALEKFGIVITELMRSYGANYPLLYVYIRENLTHVESDRTEWAQYMRILNRRYGEALIAIVQDGVDDGTIRPLASARVIAFGIAGSKGDRPYVRPGPDFDANSRQAGRIGAAADDIVGGGPGIDAVQRQIGCASCVTVTIPKPGGGLSPAAKTTPPRSPTGAGEMSVDLLGTTATNPPGVVRQCR
jgi:hypothetical protein